MAKTSSSAAALPLPPPAPAAAKQLMAKQISLLMKDLESSSEELFKDDDDDDDDDETSRTCNMDDSMSHHDSSGRLLGSKKSLRFSSSEAVAPLEQKQNEVKSKKSFAEADDDDGEEALLMALEPLSAARSSFKKRHVTFQSIHIQEYAIIPGENPAVTMGVPLTIDWTPLNTFSCDLDEYEVARTRPSRSMMQMRIPMMQRYHMLEKLDFSRQEINAHVREATILRKQRRRTCETLHLEPVEAEWERTRRAIANATWNRSKKHRERQWLQRHVTQQEQQPVSSVLETTTTESLAPHPAAPQRTISTTESAISQSISSVHSSIVRTLSYASGRSNKEENGDGDNRRRQKTKVPNSAKKKEREDRRKARQAEERLKRQRSLLKSVEAMERRQQPRTNCYIKSSMKKPPPQQQKPQRLDSHRRDKIPSSHSESSLELWSHVASESVVVVVNKSDEAKVPPPQQKLSPSLKKAKQIGHVAREYSLQPTVAEEPPTTTQPPSRNLSVVTRK